MLMYVFISLSLLEMQDLNISSKKSDSVHTEADASTANA
jgi:hypothetical protein